MCLRRMTCTLVLPYFSPQLCESVLAYQVACAVAERIPRLGHRAVGRDALPQLRLLPVQVALHVTNVCATIYPS